jgi:uncharacterized protein YjbI with pentapeptide repeats
MQTSGTRPSEIRALAGANLRGAHVTGVEVSRADLSGANLSGKDLSDATLSEADLSEADLEATFLERDASIARDYGHLTAAEAAELAATSNVKQLVLTHISGRYPDNEILAEAAKAFPNSRVAMDFERVVI